MQLIAFKASQICLHMSVAFAVTYAFTGSLAVGGIAAVVEPICNVTLMPLHDKLWERVRQRRQQAHVTVDTHAPVAVVSTAA
ncbi:DUF2061 domain-containing protein [Paenalcaligenes suwonensis]|nr:DUF2061 domain-containing protein [Paenalcaligenes suwonensis]